MSKKLRLTLDALKVESFAPVEKTEGRGTVAGYDYTTPDEGCTGPDTDCSGFNTCDLTCFDSCGGTCRWNTCNVPWACP
jgi:hypothetical protein